MLFLLIAVWQHMLLQLSAAGAIFLPTIQRKSSALQAAGNLLKRTVMFYLEFLFFVSHIN